VLFGGPQVLRDFAMATIIVFLYMGCTLAHLANTTEPCVCGGDAALCQITLTTCYYYKCKDYNPHEKSTAGALYKTNLAVTFCIDMAHRVTVPPPLTVITIITISVSMDVYGAVSHHSHGESSPGAFDEQCRISALSVGARRPP